MLAVTVEEAQAGLPELIERLSQGEEVLITRDSQPVAQLVSVARGKPLPVFGSCKGKLIIAADDDEHLLDFREYME